MLKYWLNILGAFLLLRVASSLVKDAEELLRGASKPAFSAEPAPEVISDAEVVS